MPKGSNFCNDWLKLVFNATPIANLADNAATSPNASLYVSLHTANPGIGGSQTTSEAAYTGYTRATVARTTGGWTASTAASTSPAATISFPAATGGSETEAYFAIGTAVSGAGKILYVGTLTPNIVVSAGVTPQISTASTITET